MSSLKLTLSIIIFVCTLFFTGCNNDEQEKTRVELAETRAKLSNTQLALAQCAKEKDSLKAALAVSEQALKDALAEIDKLAEENNILAQEKDKAVKKMNENVKAGESLEKSLAEQKQKIENYENSIKVLNGKLEEMGALLKTAAVKTS